MNITTECPGCGAKFDVENVLARITEKARSKLLLAKLNERDAAKEHDRARAETEKASAELDALLALATTLGST